MGEAYREGPGRWEAGMESMLFSINAVKYLGQSAHEGAILAHSFGGSICDQLTPLLWPCGEAVLEGMAEQNHCPPG